MRGGWEKPGIDIPLPPEKDRELDREEKNNLEVAIMLLKSTKEVCIVRERDTVTLTKNATDYGPRSDFPHYNLTTNHQEQNPYTRTRWTALHGCLAEGVATNNRAPSIRSMANVFSSQFFTYE